MGVSPAVQWATASAPRKAILTRSPTWSTSWSKPSARAARMVRLRPWKAAGNPSWAHSQRLLPQLQRHQHRRPTALALKSRWARTLGAGSTSGANPWARGHWKLPPVPWCLPQCSIRPSLRTKASLPEDTCCKIVEMYWILKYGRHDYSSCWDARCRFSPVDTAL